MCFGFRDVALLLAADSRAGLKAPARVGRGWEWVEERCLEGPEGNRTVGAAHNSHGTAKAPSCPVLEAEPRGQGSA